MYPGQQSPKLPLALIEMVEGLGEEHIGPVVEKVAALMVESSKPGPDAKVEVLKGEHSRPAAD